MGYSPFSRNQSFVTRNLEDEAECGGRQNQTTKKEELYGVLVVEFAEMVAVKLYVHKVLSLE
ncbi:unnamed protein product [Citrullus colocynthis]|uniref:Uncharacterized protein n=1 Tax=Citrullus colocynthis TaxID=252529 RepID=A0ABP0Y0M6_9ROSI